jgi:hypothetical protein
MNLAPQGLAQPFSPPMTREESMAVDEAVKAQNLKKKAPELGDVVAVCKWEPLPEHYVIVGGRYNSAQCSPQDELNTLSIRYIPQDMPLGSQIRICKFSQWDRKLFVVARDFNGGPSSPCDHVDGGPTANNELVIQRAQ